MHVLYLTKDLLFSSRVCSLAREAGAAIDVRPSFDANAVRADTSLVLFDLGLPQLDLAVVMQQIRESGRPIRTVAYGAHVDTARLAAAEQAGCDFVLPRSQFDQRIGSILRELSPPERAGDA